MRARVLLSLPFVVLAAACSATVGPDGGRPDVRVDGAADVPVPPPDVPVPPPDVPVPPPDVPVPPPDVPVPPPDGSSSCRANSDCAAREYCAGTGCNTPGTCAARPEACPAIYAPVCGCDGRTHGNACSAASAGVRVAANGECPTGDGGVDGGVSCGGTTCAAGQVCCAATGRCYDPACLSCCMFPPRRCLSNGDCGATEYCDGPSCMGPGVCTARPTACPRIYDPVCGCDGVTYANSCVAATSGARVVARGACPGPDAGVDSGTRCGAGVVCPVGQICCAATGSCYDPRCLSCCMPRPMTCTTNAECASTDYCAATTCAGSGTCTPRPTACPLLYDPVCGCDGATHPNSCAAASRGVRVSYPGVCGTSVDAGVRDGGSIDAGIGLCATVLCVGGTVCCPSTGRCYDPRCLSCCM